MRAADQNLAFIRKVNTGKNLDEGGLASAIVAEKAMDLAGPTSKDTSLSAITEPKYLLTDSSSTSGGHHLLLMARLRIAVEQDRDHHHGAHEQLEPVGIDARVENAHLHDAEISAPNMAPIAEP